MKSTSQHPLRQGLGAVSFNQFNASDGFAIWITNALKALFGILISIEHYQYILLCDNPINTVRCGYPQNRGGSCGNSNQHSVIFNGSQGGKYHKKRPSFYISLLLFPGSLASWRKNWGPAHSTGATLYHSDRGRNAFEKKGSGTDLPGG